LQPLHKIYISNAFLSFKIYIYYLKSYDLILHLSNYYRKANGNYEFYSLFLHPFKS